MTIENMVYSESISDYTSARPQRGFEDVGSRKWLTRRMEGVRPYVYSAMMRTGTGGLLIHCDSHDDSGERCSESISSLESSLSQYNTPNPRYHAPVPLSSQLSAISYVKTERMLRSLPAHMVREQIGLLTSSRSRTTLHRHRGDMQRPKQPTGERRTSTLPPLLPSQHPNKSCRCAHLFGASAAAVVAVTM